MRSKLKTSYYLEFAIQFQATKQRVLITIIFGLDADLLEGEESGEGHENGKEVGGEPEGEGEEDDEEGAEEEGEDEAEVKDDPSEQSPQATYGSFVPNTPRT